LNAFEWSIAFAEAALVTEKDQSARTSLVLDMLFCVCVFMLLLLCVTYIFYTSSVLVVCCEACCVMLHKNVKKVM